ncbi:hypothetical protein LZ30DRAFT_749272 [Colletotrichum cereale]|nr:hypothetical protein LZ30DRAFT_749272 [Colletotrichum cereale]
MAEGYRNAAEAEIKGHYLFRPSNGDDCILPAGTPVLLHRSQAPFRMPHDDSEWVTITPPVTQEYYAGGERRERCVPMLEGSHPGIVIPAIHIRMRVRIIRDFVPGVPEHDGIAVIGAATIRRTRSSQRGRCDMGKYQAVRRKTTRAEQDMVNKDGLVGDSSALNTPKILVNRNVPNIWPSSKVFRKRLTRKPRFRSSRHGC